MDTYTLTRRAGPEIARGNLTTTLAGSLLDKSAACATGQNPSTVDALLQQDIGCSVGVGLGLSDGGRKGTDREERDDGEELHSGLVSRYGVCFLPL